MPSFDDESLLDPALVPLAPPEAPDDDEPPDEPVTDELPRAPVPDDELPIAPDDEVEDGEPVLDEPDEPDAPLDEPLMPPLLPEPLEPILPLLDVVAGLALDDELPERLPDEPALADEPPGPLFRLLD